MNEAQFTRKINKKLPKEVYQWKISDRFTSGIPDAYYSGPIGDLWVEYKYLPEPPKSNRRYAKLTELQKNWLRGRHGEGRKVVTIVGYGDGTANIILGDSFELPLDPANVVSHEDVVTFIRSQVCGQ